MWSVHTKHIFQRAALSLLRVVIKSTRRAINLLNSRLFPLHLELAASLRPDLWIRLDITSYAKAMGRKVDSVRRQQSKFDTLLHKKLRINYGSQRFSFNHRSGLPSSPPHSSQRCNSRQLGLPVYSDRRGFCSVPRQQSLSPSCPRVLPQSAVATPVSCLLLGPLQCGSLQSQPSSKPLASVWTQQSSSRSPQPCSDHQRSASILSRHVQGVCDLIAWTMKINQGLDVDPVKNVAICCGQSEAFAAAILSVVDQGDEVLLLDPAYETYEACITMAGGTPVYVSLNPPNWTLNIEELMEAFTCRTKAIVLNSPHNPTGKVFSKSELMIIAEMCCRMDCLAITDEVYEHITFDSEHISLASLPGMLERTIITSSMSKTFSVTGWRVGWAVAPFEIASSIWNIHVKLTDSAPAPFQEAALIALKSSPEYLKNLRTEYKERRDFIVDLLGEVGFKVHFKPQGAVFVFAELPETCTISDVEYVAEMIKVAGVAAVPGCGFFHDKGQFKKQDLSQSALGSIQRPESLGNSEVLHTTKNYRNRYIRFAYCKSKCTLLAAADKLHKYNKKFGGAI